MKCSEADAFIHTYVDGELDGSERDAYEQHLLSCNECSRSCRLQARFKAAIRGHLPPREVPEGLRRRIEAAIVSAPPPPRRWRWQLWPKLVAGAAAVGAVAFFAVGYPGKPAMGLEAARRTFTAQIPMDVVSSSCGAIADWFRGRVDFPVKPPPDSVGARCEGGRLVNVRDRLAAYLTLQALGGHKVAVMVFDGEDEEDIEAPSQRVVNGLNVFTVTHRGASTAAFRRDGLNYVVTGELDPETLTNFLTVAFRP